MKHVRVLYIFLGIVLVQSAWIQSLGLDDYDEVIREEVIAAVASLNYRILPGARSIIIRTSDGQEIKLPIQHIHELIPQEPEIDEDEEWAEFVLSADEPEEQAKEQESDNEQPEEEAEEQEDDKIAEVDEIHKNHPAQR